MLHHALTFACYYFDPDRESVGTETSKVIKMSLQCVRKTK